MFWVCHNNPLRVHLHDRLLPRSLPVYLVSSSSKSKYCTKELYCEISVESNTWLLSEIRSIKKKFCFVFSPFCHRKNCDKENFDLLDWSLRAAAAAQSQAAVSHNSTLIISNRTHESISEREKNKAALSPSPLCVWHFSVVFLVSQQLAELLRFLNTRPSRERMLGIIISLRL